MNWASEAELLWTLHGLLPGISLVGNVELNEQCAHNCSDHSGLDSRLEHGGDAFPHS
jgi:hypothetical protein